MSEPRASAPRGPGAGPVEARGLARTHHNGG